MSSSPSIPVTDDKNRNITKAKEELRRLKLVDYHRKHNDLKTLAALTEIWKDTGHMVLHELHAAVSMEPKPSPTELLAHLRIPPEHVKCECDDLEN